MGKIVFKENVKKKKLSLTSLGLLNITINTINFISKKNWKFAYFKMLLNNFELKSFWSTTETMGPRLIPTNTLRFADIWDFLHLSLLANRSIFSVLFLGGSRSKT